MTYIDLDQRKMQMRIYVSICLILKGRLDMSNEAHIGPGDKSTPEFFRRYPQQARNPSASWKLDDARRLIIYKKRGQVLRQEFNSIHTAYLVEDGWIGSTAYSATGNRALTGLHLPGDIVGIADLLAERRSCDLVALCDVAIRSVSRSELYDQFAQPFTSAAVAKSLATQIHAASAFLAAVLSGDSLGRIAALALHILERVTPDITSAEVVIMTPLTQNDMGDIIGMTPIHVNRTVRTLREASILDWNRRQLTIPDPLALKRYVSLQVCGQR